MKTSNKILLILGLALLVSPLVFISIYVKAHYENRDFESFNNMDQKSPGMISIPTKAFNSIVINGNKVNNNFTYAIMQADDYGVKIPEGLKNVTSAKINSKGQLEITTNYMFKNNSFVNIYIYAPFSTSIYFDNLHDGATVYGSIDSLSVNADNCKSTISVRSSKTLNIVAKNSKVSFSENLNTLILNAQGNSVVKYDSDYDSDTLKVNKLELNLQDKSEFSVKNLIANSIVGYVAESAKLVGIDRSEVKKP